MRYVKDNYLSPPPLPFPFSYLITYISFINNNKRSTPSPGIGLLGLWGKEKRPEEIAAPIHFSDICPTCSVLFFPLLLYLYQVIAKPPGLTVSF